MVRKELRFYCVVCLETKTSRLYKSPARLAAFQAVFVFNMACKRPNRVCGPCDEQLREPYEIVLKDGSIVRLVRVTSRHLNSLVPGKPRGLFPLDLVPADAFMPYPGKLVKAVDYERFKRKFEAELTHEWSKGGPKESGTPSLLFGQYATAAPRNVAHFMNCAKGLKGHANCRWGQARVTPLFRETYPDLDKAGLVDGLVYPGIRVKKDVAPGEELLISSYGSQFWPRMKREKGGDLDVIRPVALPAALRSVLDGEDEGARRGRKRARTE